MESASITSFLRTGQLGTFDSTTSQDAVLAALGPPPYWEGKEKNTYSKSMIWVYDSVQLNFNGKMKLDELLIHFHPRYLYGEILYPDCHNSFFTLNDLSITNICTPDRLSEFLDANNISATINKLTSRRVFINTQCGTQVDFATITDHAQSMELETRVSTDTPYLYRIKTVLSHR